MAASWPEHKKVKPPFCVEELLLVQKLQITIWRKGVLEGFRRICCGASWGPRHGLPCHKVKMVVLLVKWNDLQGFWARWSDPGGRSTPCHKGGGKGFSTSWIAKISSNFILNFNWGNIMIEIFRWERFSTGLSPCPWRSRPLYSISLIQANTR